MDLKQKISELLKRHKMSHSDIASFVGVSERAIYRWSKGKEAHRVFEKKIDELLTMKKVKEISRG